MLQNSSHLVFQPFPASSQSLLLLVPIKFTLLLVCTTNWQALQRHDSKTNNSNICTKKLAYQDDVIRVSVLNSVLQDIVGVWVCMCVWTTQFSTSCANSQHVTIWLTHQLWRNSLRQSIRCRTTRQLVQMEYWQKYTKLVTRLSATSYSHSYVESGMRSGLV